MSRSRHTVPKYLNDEKTHSAKDTKMSKRLEPNTNQLYQCELVISEMEPKGPIFVGVFVLDNAIRRMLDLY